MKQTALPEIGYLRLAQIIGNSEAGIPAIIPVSKSTWWQKCKADPTWPQPVKLGFARCTFWRVSEVYDLLEKIEKGGVK